MARVALQIGDPADRYTLKAVLEAAGHRIVEESPDVWISDSPRRAIETATQCPTLVLTTTAGIPEAVEAMREGVYGYIFRPLQPGEADIMVARVLEAASRLPATYSGSEDLRSLEAVEREHILRVLRTCKGNHSVAARILGIGRNTLWRKLRLYENQ